MTSKQYEELCRFFLAQQLRIPVEKIISVLIANPQRPNLPSLRHQIDLYWETEDAISLHLHIANAKWRGERNKVDQPDVMLLQQVKQKVAAHKAVMIASSDFTSGAIAAAKDEGIALHILKPEFDYHHIDPKNTTAILHEIQAIAARCPEPIYSHQIVHRAFDLAQLETATLHRPSAVESLDRAMTPGTRTVAGCEIRAMVSSSNGMPGGGHGLNGTGHSGGFSTRGGGGFRTR